MVRRFVKWMIPAFLALVSPAWAGQTVQHVPNSYKGWEHGGAYDRLYKASEFDSFKGTVMSIIEVRPMKGMEPGVALVVKERGGDKVIVHVGPKRFLDFHGLGIRKGDRVKVKGAWAEINGQEIFMASKIKRSEYDECKVRRSRDGYPFWSMTEEEIKANSN